MLGLTRPGVFYTKERRRAPRTVFPEPRLTENWSLLDNDTFVKRATRLVKTCGISSERELWTADRELVREIKARNLAGSIAFSPRQHQSPATLMNLRTVTTTTNLLTANQAPMEERIRAPDGRSGLAREVQQELFSNTRILLEARKMIKSLSDKAYDLLARPIHDLMTGSYPAAAVFSAAAVETELRRRHAGDVNFYSLIGWAKKAGLISKEDARELHEIREARNAYVHDTTIEVGLEDAFGVFKTAAKIIQKLVHSQSD